MLLATLISLHPALWHSHITGTGCDGSCIANVRSKREGFFLGAGWGGPRKPSESYALQTCSYSVCAALAAAHPLCRSHFTLRLLSASLVNGGLVDCIQYFFFVNVCQHMRTQSQGNLQSAECRRRWPSKKTSMRGRPRWRR
jgi:hypothetical protein